MARIALAQPDQVVAVYRESYALWGGGLSFEGYLDLWRDLRATPWARRNLEFHVLAGDRDEVLSSVKSYRLTFRVDGRDVPGLVIGALFTPTRYRRRGHARTLLEAVLGNAASDGARLALLYSDVGRSFYERSGFRAVDASDVSGRVPRGLRSPAGWRFATMGREHRRAVAEAREATAARARLSIVRDEPLWEFLRTRSRGFFDRYVGEDVRQRCRVALRGGEVAGYTVYVEGRGEWSLREIGAVDGDPATEAAILSASGGAVAAAGHRGVHGWLAPEVTGRLPDWRWSRSPRRRAVPMLAGLGGHPAIEELCRPGAADLTFLDQF